jgi:hypothetical protein
MFLYYFYIIWLRICVFKFIHVPDDGSAEPKHVAYWHNRRVKWYSVQYIYIYTVVCQTVFIITVIEVTHRDDPS